jgi:hypothetical protein
MGVKQNRISTKCSMVMRGLWFAFLLSCDVCVSFLHLLFMVILSLLLSLCLMFSTNCWSNMEGHILVVDSHGRSLNIDLQSQAPSPSYN